MSFFRTAMFAVEVPESVDPSREIRTAHVHLKDCEQQHPMLALWEAAHAFGFQIGEEVSGWISETDRIDGWFVAEAGLLTLASMSHRRSAKPFFIWLCGEVFPCTREHGYYPSPILPGLDSPQTVVRPDPAQPTLPDHSRRRQDRVGGTPGYVYFVQSSAGPIKIGSSKNPRRRIKLLDIGASVLTLLATEQHPGGKEAYLAEKAYHARFSASNVKGEWFAPTPELLAVIEDLQSTATQGE